MRRTLTLGSSNSLISGAGERSRTSDLLITNDPQCRFIAFHTVSYRSWLY